MPMERRHFMQLAGAGFAAAGLMSNRAWAQQAKVKVGMCDWNLGASASPQAIPKAKEANLDGVQVSVGTNPNNVPLRDPEVIDQYKALCDEHGVQVCSVAAGGILNSIPLATEPQSAVYVIEALEAAKELGATNILMAFFGNGDLRLRDARGNTRNISEGPFREYELDSKKVTRVVEVLRQIAPRAEELGIAMGLENTITASQNMEIIERVGSDMLQVYYDVGNSWGNGYNVPAEIRMLGNDRICEIHLKDWETPLFSSGEGMVDWLSVAEACDEIGFDKWYVLETSGRDKKFIEDTHDNVAFAKNMLA
mgnify:CR=1 FL=1